MEVLCNLRKAKAKQNKNSITIILSDTHVLSYKRHTIDMTVIVISCHIYHTNLIILYYLGSPETISNRPSYRGFWYLNVRNMGRDRRDPCSPLAAHLQPLFRKASRIQPVSRRSRLAPRPWRPADCQVFQNPSSSCENLWSKQKKEIGELKKNTDTSWQFVHLILPVSSMLPPVLASS